MIIERDNKILDLERQLSNQLNKISQDLNLQSNKAVDKSSNIPIVSVEDAIKELQDMGVSVQ